MKKRKICVITGTRAEFGLLKPVMDKIQRSDSLKLQVIVTGTHLLPEYGETISDILKTGIPVDARVPITVSGDDKTAMSLSIGMGVISFTQALNDLNPDIVLVLEIDLKYFPPLSLPHSVAELLHIFPEEIPFKRDMMNMFVMQ